MCRVVPGQNRLYHDYERPKTEFMRENPEFYELLKQMTLFFGDHNEKVETVQPTPEMFRLLVKCAEAAVTGELDFGHMVPRGMYNQLASEFQRISGVKVKRLEDKQVSIGVLSIKYGITLNFAAKNAT